MKICMLADASSNHTVKICNYLVKRGHKVFVISFQEGNIEGVEVFSFNETDSRTRSDFSKLNYLSHIFKIKNIIKEIRPDILHAHYVSSYGTIGSLLNFHPYIISAWGSDIYLFPNKSKLHQSLIRYNLSKADIIMSTSQVMAEEIKKYSNKKAYVTPFGVDLNVFKPRTSTRTDENSTIKIGISKTLHTLYGIDYLIKSFKLAKDNLDGQLSLKLFIAGKGEHEGKFKDLVNSLDLNQSVEFLDHLNRQEIVEFYHMIDFAAFPSLSESFGVSAIEAQACGKPVIVSNVGGLTEVTKAGESSLVVESENVEELSEAIIYLSVNHDIRRQMGDNAYKYVRSKYDIEENFKLIEDIYADVKSMD